jgi:hypothetical protein
MVNVKIFMFVIDLWSPSKNGQASTVKLLTKFFIFKAEPLIRTAQFL